MAAGTFEIKRAKDGQFYFNLKAGRNEMDPPPVRIGCNEPE